MATRGEVFWAACGEARACSPGAAEPPGCQPRAGGSLFSTPSSGLQAHPDTPSLPTGSPRGRRRGGRSPRRGRGWGGRGGAGSSSPGARVPEGGRRRSGGCGRAGELGPRKTGVQEKLSHLSLSISTWHLGRALDKAAAYPGPGHLAGPLAMSEILGFLALCFRITYPFTLKLLLGVREPFLGPDCFLFGKRELHPVALSGFFFFFLMFHFDFNIWTLVKELGIAERCFRHPLDCPCSKCLFLSLFSWK